MVSNTTFTDIMVPMKSRERFIVVMEGRKPDRTPLACVTACTTVELQKLTGCFMPEVHHDPEKLAKLCGSNHDVLGFDAAAFILNYFSEPAALGVEMSWGDQSTLPMFLSHPWQVYDDAVVPGDFLDRDPNRTNLESIRIGKRLYGDRMAVLGKVMGPLSFVQVMHGVENTMMGLLNEPEKMSHYLDVAVDILTLSANAQLDAGADAISIGEGGAGGNMVSPLMHERFLLEPHKRMVSSIHGSTIMHICGDITPRLELLLQTGVRCFNFDWSIDPGVMRRTAGKKMLLMGNINTSDLLNGTSDEIERQTIRCLDAGIDIISPGCALSPECPNDNLRAMSTAIEKWYEHH
jgi:[methyl-Co(III) methanol-specific corrinoid protein]:coenzyme M methyltransferase